MTQFPLNSAQQKFIEDFDDGGHNQEMRDIATLAFAHRNALARGWLQSPAETLADLVAKLDKVTT